MSKGHDGFSEQLEDMKRQAQSQQALKRQQDPSIAIEREIQNADGQNELLRQVGVRIRPKFHRHVASFAVHVYKDENSENGQIIAQVSGIDSLPEAIAQNMLKELTIHVTHKYGRKPQAKRGEDLSYKNEKPTSPILAVGKPKLVP